MDSNLLRFDKTKKFLFIDYETCNLCLSFRVNRPWQVSFLKVVGNTVIEEHDYYVDWPKEFSISPEAAIVTKFDKAKYDRLKRPNTEVFEVMSKSLEECDFIIGHNILGFDMYLVFEWYKMMGKDASHLIKKVIDTAFLSKGMKAGYIYKNAENLWSYQYKLSHKILKGIKYNLTAMGKELGIECDYDNLHDAKNDLKLNKLIWDKLKFMIEI